jgi:putative membrane protein
VSLPIDSDGWRRLSPRMLLIHPVVEVTKSIPLLLGVLFAGSHSGTGAYWGLGVAVVVIVLSLTRWFTTRYRIDDDQIQLRHGLLRRQTVNARLDRVRTVDVTAHLLHRVLGLSRVTIGTGTSDRRRRPDGLTLDGVDTDDAQRLRAELLHHVLAAPEQGSGEQAGPLREQDLAIFDPAWIRYAPFNLSGAVTALAVVGFALRIVNDAHVDLAKVGPLRHAGNDVTSASLIGIVVIAVIVVLVFIALTSTTGYVLAFWGFHLTRHEGGSLHVSRGLITTRNTSIEHRRLRGVELSEPLLLRWVGGARTLAIATGLRVGRGSERGGTVLLPPAPAGEAIRVAAAVLETDGPIVAPLRAHGPSARRRRYVRALGVTLLVLSILLAIGLIEGWPWPLALLALVMVPAALLAEDRYRSLGHLLTHGHLVVRSGSLVRRRVAIKQDGVIGWKMRRTFFQRRLGLMTLTAATAAGRQGYRIIDVDLAEAESVIAVCSPGVLDGLRC